MGMLVAAAISARPRTSQPGHGSSTHAMSYGSQAGSARSATRLEYPWLQSTCSRTPGTHGLAHRAHHRRVADGIDAGLELERSEAVLRHQFTRLLRHLLGRAEAENVRELDFVRPAAEQAIQRDAGGLSDHVVERHVDRSLGGGVVLDLLESRPGELQCERVDAGQRRCEPVAHRGDDRDCGLAIHHRPRRSFRLADEPLVGVHAHEHVVQGVELPGRELDHFAHRHAKRDCLDPRDLHRAPLLVDAGPGRGGLRRISRKTTLRRTPPACIVPASGRISRPDTPRRCADSGRDPRPPR